MGKGQREWQRTYDRRKIKTEEKARVVAALWVDRIDSI